MFAGSTLGIGLLVLTLFLTFGNEVPVVPVIPDANATDPDIPPPYPFDEEDVEGMKNEKDAIMCKQHNDLDLLDNIVGIGWDNLRDLPMGEVFATTVQNCRTTPDGRYLVPDNVIALEEKVSKLDNMATFSATHKEHMQSTATSLSMEASAAVPNVPVTIGASFGYETQESKHLAISTESSILRTAFTYHAYSFVLDAPNAAFNKDLEDRLVEIGRYIERNEREVAIYLAELIIRDYGTHVITRAKVGAEISREDYVDKQSMQKGESTMNSIRAGASVGFKDMASFSMSSGRKTEQQSRNDYSKSLHQSRVKSKGALNAIRIAQKVKDAENRAKQGSLQQDFVEPLTPLPMEPTYRHYTDTSGRQIRIPRPRHLDPSRRNEEEVVSLDQSGEPLYQMINSYTVNGLDAKVADKVALYIKTAYEGYAAMNTRVGCMTPGADGFDPNANVHNDSYCKEGSKNHAYKFGGFYQLLGGRGGDTTEFDFLANGITGTDLCPVRYKSIPIGKASKRDVEGAMYMVDRYLFVCEAEGEPPPRMGYLFGGAYTKSHPNPFTGTQRCPGNFVGIKVFNTVFVCVSRNYDMDQKYAVDYGGFVSCQSENKTCDNGFVNYLIDVYATSKGATIYEGCELYVCIKPGQIKELQLMNIKLPPFSNLSDTTIATTTPKSKFFVANQDTTQSKPRVRTTTTGGIF